MIVTWGAGRSTWSTRRYTMPNAARRFGAVMLPLVSAPMTMCCGRGPTFAFPAARGSTQPAQSRLAAIPAITAARVNHPAYRAVVDVHVPIHPSFCLAQHVRAGLLLVQVHRLSPHPGHCASLVKRLVSPVLD